MGIHPFICCCCTVWLYALTWLCVSLFSPPFSAKRLQVNPVGSVLITWCLYNGLASRNESLCLPEEMPFLSESFLIHLHDAQLYTLSFSSAQISPTMGRAAAILCFQTGFPLFVLRVCKFSDLNKEFKILHVICVYVSSFKAIHIQLRSLIISACFVFPVRHVALCSGNWWGEQM